MYQTLVSSLFPIFFSFYLGAWCDLFGRKLLFFIYLVSRMMEEAVVIICGIFLESKKEYLLLQNIPAAISGKHFHSTCGQTELFYLRLMILTAVCTSHSVLLKRFLLKA